MLTLILAIVLLALIGIGAVALTMAAVLKAHHKKRAHAGLDIEQVVKSASKVEKCARCGESRIIISLSDGLCASCYSALRTKKTE